MQNNPIQKSVATILASLPPHVQLVAAAKTRTPEELKCAVEAGVTLVGYNYVQEAEAMFSHLDHRVQWHLIGHLQHNKAKRAVQLFDMIETIDSLRIAERVDRYCAEIDKIMPVLIEINSGKESNKTGVLPENLDDLVGEVSQLSHLRIRGLMTMGPRFGNPEDSRLYFKATKAAFDHLLQTKLVTDEFTYLSMGMSNTYPIAIEEGANIVRVGTKLFGER
ncbi:YggS family pyridoxal phosphate-dependent enzyme [candidate division KSB1 bacterium]|nr:YggS family pyridoxal phosphate-dependent enzyme [candidate division KSB1 bacterium]